MELKIQETYLDELMDSVGRSLVGKVCRRFEIHENKDDIKREAKELIYESLRQFKELLKAHAEGINLTVFQFTRQEEKLTPTKS